MRKPRARSAVTNHTDLLPNLDGRRAEARRFRDLVLSFISDAGGIENCSEIRLGLLRRLASTTVAVELLESQLINGRPIDVTQLCTLASTALRLATRLGLERVAKEISTLPPVMSVEAYIARKAGAQARYRREERPARTTGIEHDTRSSGQRRRRMREAEEKGTALWQAEQAEQQPPEQELEP